MNSEEIAIIEKNISDKELSKLAKILLRLNKMIDKLKGSNETQKYLESLHDYKKDQYETKINNALVTLKKLISNKVKDNNLYEIGHCLHQDQLME